MLLFASVAAATEVRGRVDMVNPYTLQFQPMPKALVILCYPNGQPIVETITGYDGFYYFHNIRPGPYLLVINRIRTIRIFIKPVRGQDIPPILMR
jgi:hypothetical protein